MKSFSLKGRTNKAVLAGLAIGTGGFVLAACGSSSATASATTATTAAPAPTVIHEYMTILTGGMIKSPGNPIYSPGNLTVPKNSIVDLTITSYDDGTAPLATGYTQYANAQGLVGGTETIGGTPAASVPNANIAHTFTIPQLGVNMPIPAATADVTGQPKNTVVVEAQFKVTKAGTYVWHCFAPCGSGSDGMSGVMATSGQMMGNLVVQ